MKKSDKKEIENMNIKISEVSGLEPILVDVLF